MFHCRLTVDLPNATQVLLFEVGEYEKRTKRHPHTFLDEGARETFKGLKYYNISEKIVGME